MVVFILMCMNKRYSCELMPSPGFWDQTVFYFRWNVGMTDNVVNMLYFSHNGYRGAFMFDNLKKEMLQYYDEMHAQYRIYSKGGKHCQYAWSARLCGGDHLRRHTDNPSRLWGADPSYKRISHHAKIKIKRDGYCSPCGRCPSRLLYCRCARFFKKSRCNFLYRMVK